MVGSVTQHQKSDDDDGDDVVDDDVLVVDDPCLLEHNLCIVGGSCMVECLP